MAVLPFLVFGKRKINKQKNRPSKTVFLLYPFSAYGNSFSRINLAVHEYDTILTWQFLFVKSIGKKVLS